MALVPIRVDRTSKPPLGTPLRSDGHWSVQGLVGAWAFNEGAGRVVFNAVGANGTLTKPLYSVWTADGIKNTSSSDPPASGALERVSIKAITMLCSNTAEPVSTKGIFNLGFSGNATSTIGLITDISLGCLRLLCRDSAGSTLYDSAGKESIIITDRKPRVYGISGTLGSDFYSFIDGKQSSVTPYVAGATTIDFDYIAFSALCRSSIPANIQTTSTAGWGLIYSICLNLLQISKLSANPWQIYEPETVWIEVGVGEQSLFAGAIYGQSSAFAQLTTAIRISASAQGTGSTSASLSASTLLTGALQGNAIAHAALSTALELAAQVNGIGSAAGTLGADISGLAGSLHGSSEAQATLATAIHLMGLAAGQCVVSGRLAKPVEILAQLRVMASDPLALTISVRDPLALRVTVH